MMLTYRAHCAGYSLLLCILSRIPYLVNLFLGKYCLLFIHIIRDILKVKGVFITEQKKCTKNICKENPTKEMIKAIPTEGRGDIVSDVLGSYTGNPDGDSVPEQDADDL